MGELIAVLSGKGGTGKTSVCAAVATALALDGKRVLCVDCDVGLRNLDISLGMSDCGALSFLDVCNEGYSLSLAAQHPLIPSLYFFTAPMNCRADSIDPEAFDRFARRAREEFDFVFLDAPAGVDAGFRLTAACADRCIVVTGPGPASVRDAARVGELLELMGKTHVRLVVNRVIGRMVTAMETTIDDMMDTAGLPLLGVIPEDRNMTLAATFNRPVVIYSRRCPASEACMRIAQRLLGVPVPIALR